MKEVIIAEVETQPSQHAEKWETYLSHDGFESCIYLNEIFPPGRATITIETVAEVSE